MHLFCEPIIQAEFVFCLTDSGCMDVLLDLKKTVSYY